MNVPTIYLAEDAGHVLLARVANHDGELFVEADFGDITFKCVDLAAPLVTVLNGTLTVATVIHDTLQTDARWTVDSTGYNFEWRTLATMFPNGGKLYQVDVRFSPASGEDVVLTWRVKTRKVYV